MRFFTLRSQIGIRKLDRYISEEFVFRYFEIPYLISALLKYRDLNFRVYQHQIGTL